MKVKEKETKRTEAHPGTARDTLARAYHELKRSPGMDVDQAIIAALGLPSDAHYWPAHLERQYHEAIHYFRKFIPIWSVTGWSSSATKSERASVVMQAAMSQRG